MTIDEMIVELQRRRILHGGDCTVVITWKGQVIDIDHSNFYTACVSVLKDNATRVVSEAERMLLIDADRNTYKDAFQEPHDVKHEFKS